MLSILRYTQKKKKKNFPIQCLVDVITQDAYQIKSPYTEEDMML